MDDTVNWLFLDLNSYFASVEQQVTPSLRGKPVGVVAVMTDTTCCIAASYEAKAYGVKTGTLVREAKVLCPGIQLVEADPKLYVRFHHAIVKAVDSCVPVASILSIDEMICRLTGSQRDIGAATTLAAKIKKTLATHVGEYLRCSIGLAPNRFLAKVASDMQKPDGLTILRLRELPQALYKLELRDFPGIGPKMEARLNEKGIFSTEQLCGLGADQTRDIWGGIVGDRFQAWLRGESTDEPETHRSTIGHSHVLPPELRTMNSAFPIVKKLTSKAAVRLRRMGYWTKGISVDVQFIKQDGWGEKVKLAECQDTPTLLKAVERLWSRAPSGKPIRVAITFFPLVATDHHTPSLFDNPKREKLSLVMDQVNEKFGHDTAYFGDVRETSESAPTRIAFTQIPDVEDF